MKVWRALRVGSSRETRLLAVTTPEEDEQLPRKAQSKNFGLIRQGQRSWLCLCLKTTVIIVDLASFRLENCHSCIFSLGNISGGGSFPSSRGCTGPSVVGGCSAWGWSSWRSWGEFSSDGTVLGRCRHEKPTVSEKGRLQMSAGCGGGGGRWELFQVGAAPLWEPVRMSSNFRP